MRQLMLEDWNEWQVKLAEKLPRKTVFDQRGNSVPGAGSIH